MIVFRFMMENHGRSRFEKGDRQVGALNRTFATVAIGNMMTPIKSSLFSDGYGAFTRM